MSALPAAFAACLRAELGAEAEPLLEALQGQPVRGLRLNPRKPAPLPGDLGIGAPVPWQPATGRYLAWESLAGSHPLHEAGAFYIQEPSAMAAVAALQPKAGERVLDLCAAPGGKSTQIADALSGAGLLVSNEPVPGRARILSRNLERMGVQNALVVSEEPERLAALWAGAFDAVLADAPCSGEGMFRKSPSVRDEWRPDSPAGCAARQKRILQCAARMLKPGGRLVYSTCTFNRTENDDVLRWLLESEPDMEPVGFSLPTGGGERLCAPSGALHLYPHRLRGEGHFVALVQKRARPGAEETLFLPAAARLKAPDRALLAAWETFADSMRLHDLTPNAMLGDALLCAPALPPLDGVRVLRAGLQLGALKGKIFMPDHALAMGLARPMEHPQLPLALKQARAYLRGETLPAPEGRSGWALATLDGLALGFVKQSDGQAKNHYPKGLRRP